MDNSAQRSLISRPGTITVLGLFGLSWIFYFPAWLGPMAAGDNLVEMWYTARFAFDQIRHGVDPLWNPYLCSGFPVGAYSNTGMYSILNIFHLFLPHVIALTFQIMALHGLAAAGLYLFLRKIGVSGHGAALGGAAFAFSGFLQTAQDYSYFMAGAAFIGFFLWSLECLRTAETGLSVAAGTLLCALLLAVQFLAGHPQITVISGLIYAIYILWYFLHKGDERNWRLPAAAAFAVFAAAILTAASWMPALELLKYSYRETIPWERFAVLSTPPHRMLAHMLFLVSSDTHENNFWIGIPVVLLAWRAIRDEWHSPIVKLFTTMLLASVVMGLGKYTPLLRLLFHLPMFNQLTAPVRYSLDIAFAASCLAALGYDSLCRRPRKIFGTGRDLLIFSGLILLCIIVICLESIKGLMSVFPDLLAGYLLIWVIARRVKIGGNRMPSAVLVIALALLPAWISRGGPWFKTVNPKPERSSHWKAIEDTISGNPPARILDIADLRQVTAGTVRRLPAHNLNMFNKWSDAAGYQPLMLDRYSKMLEMDFVGLIGIPQRLLVRQNRALDLLNVRSMILPAVCLKEPESFFRYVPDKKTFQGVTSGEGVYLMVAGDNVVGFRAPEFVGKVNGMAIISGLSDSADIEQGKEVAELTIIGADNKRRNLKLRAGIETAETMYRVEEEHFQSANTIHGIPFFTHIDMPLWAGLTHKFSFKAREIKGIAIITYLYNAESVPQDTPVASVTVTGDDGSKREFILRAGVDTAHWTVGSPNVNVAHKPAKVAEAFEAGGVSGHNFFSLFEVSPPVRGSFITVKCLLKDKNSGIFISQISLADALGKYSSLDATGIAHNKAGVVPSTTNAESYLYFARWNFPSLNPKYIELKSMMKDYPHAALGINTMTFLKEGDQSWPVHPVDIALGNPDRFEVQYEDDLAVVIKNKAALPRAWLADETLVLKPEIILDAIKSGKRPDGRVFDPLKTALIERPLPRTVTALSPSPAQTTEIQFVEYTANMIRLRVETPHEAMLVLSEIYYPGWETVVDGRPAETLQVDYILRGVLLGPGSHEVVMRFRPQTVRRGRIISLVTLAIVLTALMVSVGLGRRRRYF